MTFSRSFLTLCLAIISSFASAQCCTYHLSFQDSYGDGWNGATLSVLVNGIPIGVYGAAGYGSSISFDACNGDLVEFSYAPGDYENENSYQFFDDDWNLLFSDGPNPAVGNVFSFTANCDPPQCCSHHLVLHDSYGDGWNGASLTVFVNGVNVGVYSAQGSGSTVSFEACNDDLIELSYTSGEFEEENSYQLFDVGWNLLLSDGPNPQTGTVFSGMANCAVENMQGLHPCNAIPLEVDGCVTADNTGLPTSGYNPGCSWYAGGQVWFQVIVPLSGNIMLQTSNGGLTDTAIGAWQGDACSNLSVIGCDDDLGNGYYSVVLLYDLTPGDTVYVEVFGYGGGTGYFDLCATDIGVVDFQSSELPIVMINTLGQSIPADNKVDAMMEIKYNGPGNLTYLNDFPNEYNGHIGIEVRGATSASFPQKPFNIETRNADGSNNNVPLLGMPVENDWCLISNFNDRSFVRNALAYHLFGEMGHYSVRTHLCEVLIDSVYQGVYLFCEKIKQDSSRVDIAELDPEDITGDEVTGGYLLNQDYWTPENSFESNYSPVDFPGLDVHILYNDPAANELMPEQKAYIAAFIDTMETALYSDNFMDPETGYRQYLSVTSFMDYFFVNELARNADGFRKSVYWNKDKNSNGGKLKAGPVWDFDWAFKNLAMCSIFAGTDGSGWAHRVNDCEYDPHSTGWHVRLLEDSTFANALYCRYEDFRTTILSTDYIFNYIDSIEALVSNAQVRHYQKWPMLGLDGFAPEVDAMETTYSGEVEKLKNWLQLRLEWMDANMPGQCIEIPQSVADLRSTKMLNVYPVPSSGTVWFEGYLTGSDLCTLQIRDLTGRLISSRSLRAGQVRTSIELNHAGFYHYQILDSRGEVQSGVLVVE